MNHLIVITYHHISNKKDNFNRVNAIEYEDFSNQLKMFKCKYNIVSVDDLIYHIDNNIKMDDKSVLLTFDDGYIEHYKYAYPLLDKMNIYGAFYFNFKHISEKKLLDINKAHIVLNGIIDKSEMLDYVLKVVKYNNIIKDENEINKLINKYYCKSYYDEPEVNFLKKLLQIELNEQSRSFVLNEMYKKYVIKKEKYFYNKYYFDVKTALKMKESGHHIGNHCYDHIRLNALSYKEQSKQIKDALVLLKEYKLIGKKWSMCYPHGAYDYNTIKILKETNCSLAFTTNNKKAQVDKNNKYMISRIDCKSINEKL